MTRSTSLWIVAAVIICFGVPAYAFTLGLGWADEFMTGWVDCTSDNSRCTFVSLYQGRISNSPLMDAPKSWEYLGNQGANTQGRLNARSKLMFRYEELTGASCFTVTASISRFKVTSGIPTIGSACTSATQTLQAVSSQTFQDCTPGDQRIQQRILPILDFSSETGTGEIFYRETVSAAGDMNSGSKDGCFKINWF